MRLSNRKQHNHSMRGSSIAELSCCLFIILTIMAALFSLLLNTTALCSRRIQLQNVANAAARSIVSDEYFLGMQRPQYDNGSSTAKARELADLMLARLGLGAAKNFQATRNTNAFTVDGKPVTLVRVSLSADIAPVGGIFTSPVTLSAVGVATSASESKANGVGVMTFYDIGNPRESHAFTFPIYNAEFVDGDGVAGIDGWSKGDRLGITKRGTSPYSPGTVHLTSGVNMGGSGNTDAIKQGTFLEPTGKGSQLW